MKRWLHLEDGVIKGMMNADVPRDELARELGEWVLQGVTPVLFDMGASTLHVKNDPLPSDTADVRAGSAQFVAETKTGTNIAWTQRAADLVTIAALYGTESEPGAAMLMIVMKRYLLDVLPDQAIHELAEMHRNLDRREDPNEL